jgi:4-amino-4-deoxy-L-arabinose transferase-like glycosyltransferase
MVGSMILQSSPVAEDISPGGDTIAPLGRKDLLLALLCAGITLACLAAAYPVSELAFNDDSSYVFTARVLAETGHLKFNGWATAALGPQAYWGALAIKVFGFSFTVVRLTTVLIGGAAAAVGYSLARRCGLRPGLAMLSSLTLSLSPLFLPNAASFMTDVPGLFFALVGLYALVRAGLAQNRGAAVRWILALVLVALVGGTVRQIVWMTALAGLPCVAWVWRKHRPVVATAVVGWLCVVVGAWATIHWVSSQPYAIPEIPISYSVRMAIKQPSVLISHALALLLTLTLLATPVILAVMKVARQRITRAQWIGLAAIVVVILVLRHALKFAPTAPWIGNTITQYGVMDFGGWGHGRPGVLPNRLWVVLSLATYAALAMGVSVGIASIIRLSKRGNLKRGLMGVTPQGWVMAALVLYGLGYFLLLLPRCAYNQAYDRYLLPLFPAVTIPLLLLYQKSESQQGRRKAFLVAAWAALIVMGAFGVAITEEVHGLNRARSAAANEVFLSGVPRTRIDAGFEYNFWTQIQTQGYINDPRIVNPPNAYQPGKDMTPAVDPLYRIGFCNGPLLADEALTDFPTVTYRSYLPPFRRELCVRRVIHPTLP